jgi:hypothetical protein
VATCTKRKQQALHCYVYVYNQQSSSHVSFTLLYVSDSSFAVFYNCNFFLLLIAFLFLPLLFIVRLFSVLLIIECDNSKLFLLVCCKFEYSTFPVYKHLHSALRLILIISFCNEYL